MMKKSACMQDAPAAEGEKTIARLINGEMVPCPKQGRDGRGGLHTDLPRYYRDHPQRAAEDGCFPVRFTPKPAGEHAMSWALRDGRIEQVWTAPEPQQETKPSIPEMLGVIADCVLELSRAEPLADSPQARNAAARLQAQMIALSGNGAAEEKRVVQESFAAFFQAFSKDSYRK